MHPARKLMLSLSRLYAIMHAYRPRRIADGWQGISRYIKQHNSNRYCKEFMAEFVSLNQGG